MNRNLPSVHPGGGYQPRRRRPALLAATLGVSLVVGGLAAGVFSSNSASTKTKTEPLAAQVAVKGADASLPRIIPVTRPKDQPSKGLLFHGLTPATTGECVGAFELDSRPGSCTHGPDEPLPGFGYDVKKQVPTIEEAAAMGAKAPGAALSADLAAGTATPCYGDGKSGNRVEVLYVYGSRDQFTKYQNSLRTWAAGIDTIYSESAKETGGTRHIRYVTEKSGSGCRPLITKVKVSDSGLGSFGATIDAVGAKGFKRKDRKYVMFVDANSYCGIGNYPNDESKGKSNRANSGPMYGRTDTGCWSAWAPAHELGHNLGAVGMKAPNTSRGGHCVDEYDVMCYKDSPYFPTMKIKCPEKNRNETRLDCNHDDYYSTKPKAGSYLATHFNVADNIFLEGTSGGGGDGGGTGTKPAAGKTYTITNGSQALLMDVSGTAKGAKVVAVKASGKAGQTWAASAGAGSSLVFKNKSTGMCLSVAGESKKLNAALIQDTCAAASKAQQWTVVASGSGYELQNVNSGMAVGPSSTEKVGSSPVVVQRKAGEKAKARSWIFKAV